MSAYYEMDDYEYYCLYTQALNFPEGKKYNGELNVYGKHITVKGIFKNAFDEPMGNELVACFGYRYNTLFALTIYGNFIYSRIIKPSYDGIVFVEDGKQSIEQTDYAILDTYDYAFDMDSPYEEYIIECLLIPDNNNAFNLNSSLA